MTRHIKNKRLQKNFFLLTLLLISYFFKMYVWSHVVHTDPSRFLSNDSTGYEGVGLALLHTGTFAASPEKPELLQSFRTLGFPIMIAGVYGVWGERQDVVILIMILFSLLTISLTYRLALTLFDLPTAYLTAFLFILDVISFSYSLRYLTETLFALFITVMLLTGVFFLQQGGSKRGAIFMSLALACATFIRPISYYLIIPIAVGYLLWTIFHRWSWSKIVSILLFIFLPYIILVATWQLRNYAYLGNSQFSTVSSGNLLGYRAASIIALHENISVAEARQLLDDQITSYLYDNPNVQFADYRMQLAVSIITDYPILFVKSQLLGAIPMMLGGGEGTLLRLLDIPLGQTLDYEIFEALNQFNFSVLLRRFASGTAIIAFTLAISYLALIYMGVLFWLGYVTLTRRMKWPDLFVWGVALYFIFISAGLEAGSRFRIPLMPVLVIYAAQGWFLFSRMVKAKIYDR